MLANRIDPCSPYELQPGAERTRRSLTINHQPRQIPSIAYGVTIRLDFKDMEGVRPMKAVRLGGTILVEDDEIGREVSLVEDPALKLPWAVDVVGLGDSGIAPAELGPNIESGVCHLRQRPVE